MELFYTVSKSALYDFVKKSIPLPACDKVQFTRFNMSRSYTLSWFDDVKQLCSCQLKGYSTDAELILKRLGKTATYRLSAQQLLSCGLAMHQRQSFSEPAALKPQDFSRLNLYYVNPQYVDYLTAAESAVHRQSHVPHVLYEGRHTKFMCGAVFKIPSVPYLYVAPVSSTIANGLGDLPINIKNSTNPRSGTLRLRYMFPVPPEVLAQIDIPRIDPPAYGQLLSKQLTALRDMASQILSTSSDMYELVRWQAGSNRFIDRCCDFPLLERACLQYGVEQRLPSIVGQQPTFPLEY